MSRIIQRMRTPPLSVLAGFGIVVSAALVIIGWLTHHPALVQLIPGLESMTLPAAAGFCLAGIALIATRPVNALEPSETSGPDSHKSVSRAVGTALLHGKTHVGTLLASLLLGLSLLAVLQWIGVGNADQWIDQVGYHWTAEASANLGRMRPMTAVGFIVIGVVLLLLNRVSTTAMPRLALLLTLALPLWGLLGIAGRLLGLEEIYKGYPGTTLPTGIGFVICGIGLLSVEFHDDRFQRYWRQDESRKINLVGATIMTMTGLIGAFGGFAVLQPLTVNELQDNLQLGLKSRNEMFKNVIEQGWRDSLTFASQLQRLDDMRNLDFNPHDQNRRASLQKVAENALSFGFSAIVLRDAAGREVARAGSFVSDPELRVTVNTLSPSNLIWKNGFVLHTRTDMLTGSQIVGTMEAERALPQLGKTLRDIAYLGKTTDFAVCAPADENMHCFPLRSTDGKVLLNLPRRFNGQLLPMSYALAGKTGVIHSKDYRGRDVIAAYAPLGTLGLGTVLKIDSAELYEPIAETLGRLLTVLMLLAAAGMVVLRLQVLPLVRKMAMEIHERKKAESELRRHRDHLDQLVHERTAALVDAKDEAEKANRTKSEFLSRMSHELRTPLNAILGFAQLIEMDALASGEDNTIQNVRDVLNSGQHLLALINDVLDFARIEIGKLKIEPSQTNLLMAAIDSIGAIRTLAEPRKIEVRLINKLLENHGEIWADPLRTKQVLLNLLSNAIKYNKEGGSIEVALETLNSEFVRLSVKDSGIGIPEEDIGELFLPFSRLHASNTCVEGAGIGLSITKDLVEMMGGRIGVKSVSGEGTTFWIDMPTYTGQAHTETGLFLP